MRGPLGGLGEEVNSATDGARYSAGELRKRVGQELAASREDSDRDLARRTQDLASLKRPYLFVAEARKLGYEDSLS